MRERYYDPSIVRLNRPYLLGRGYLCRAQDAPDLEDWLTFLHRLCFLTLLTLISSVPALAGGAPPRSTHHQLPQYPSGVAFAFGTGGAIMFSGTVTIRIDGVQQLRTVEPHTCTHLLHPAARVAHATLVRLLRLADSVGFFYLPRIISSGQRNIDVASEFISIHTTTGVTTVTERPGSTNRSFDQLYRSLRRAAPFTFSCHPPTIG